MTGKLVLFSEGAIHWTSYRPIIRECLHRDINFAYLTLDAADPALAIESSLISKKVFKRSFLSYLRLSQMKVTLFTTTPHIGTKGYPLRRSPYIRELIHFFHAFSDTCFYKLGASIVTIQFFWRGLRKKQIRERSKENEIYPPRSCCQADCHIWMIFRKGWRNLAGMTLAPRPKARFWLRLHGVKRIFLIC